MRRHTSSHGSSEHTTIPTPSADVAGLSRATVVGRLDSRPSEATEPSTVQLPLLGRPRQHRPDRRALQVAQPVGDTTAERPSCLATNCSPPRSKCSNTEPLHPAGAGLAHVAGHLVVGTGHAEAGVTQPPAEVGLLAVEPEAGVEPADRLERPTGAP